MQRIEKILMREVFLAIALEKVSYGTRNVAQERLSITCETLMTQIRVPRGCSGSKLFERVISR